MITITEIIKTTIHLPWRDIALGTLVTTTSLSSGLLWYIASKQGDDQSSLVPPDAPQCGTGDIHVQSEDIAIAKITSTDVSFSDDVEISDNDLELDGQSENQIEAVKRDVSWVFTGATRIGKMRSENQDAYSLHRFSDDTLYLGVFDGAGGVEGGKQASETAAQVCKDYIVEHFTEDSDIIDLLKSAIDAAREAFVEQKLPGITTAIIALVQGVQVYYATLGDGTLASIWPDGMVHHFLVPHHVLGQPDNIIAGYVGDDCMVPPRVGMVTLEAGTHLMLMSDGVSDLFPYAQYAELRAAFAAQLLPGSHFNLAENLLDQIEEARDPKTEAYFHSDNLTLILAYVSKLPSNSGCEAHA